MLECPFSIVSCTWPRPASVEQQQWVSIPAWDAPLLPTPPLAFLEQVNGTWYWTVNFREYLRGDLRTEESVKGGEMRGFHLVMRMRMQHNGVLHAIYDDGCTIRQNGTTAYTQTGIQQPTQIKLEVQPGDLLEIALQHTRGDWRWSSYLLSADHPAFAASPDPVELLLPHLERVQALLQRPNGPPLKMYTSGREPLRTAIAIYSLILNGGYIPSEVYVFGDYQWHPAKRALLRRCLPFATFVSSRKLFTHLESVAGRELVRLAVEHWFVMKVCATLFHPPYEYCLLDDDVIILDRLDEALQAFQTRNLVYTTNYDYSEDYLRDWGQVFPGLATPLPTGTFNAGLYWLRNTREPGAFIAQILQGQLDANTRPLGWEQGMIATAFASEPTLELSPQRYYAPALDGLPGGFLGYDYAANPCGFISMHFLGVTGLEKPTDGKMLYLLPQILKDEALSDVQNHQHKAREKANYGETR